MNRNQAPTGEIGKLEKMSQGYQKQYAKQEEDRLRQTLRLQSSANSGKIIVTYPLPKPLNETSLYREILISYGTKELRKLEYFTQEFTKRYPNGVFADNVIYLLGSLNLALGAPTEALRHFERLLQNYPLSNKKVSALFGKGVAYRKMQLFNYAEKVFAEVKKEFPGSPESFKVELELRLLKVESSKKS